MEAEAAHEKRIAHLQQMAARRMMKAGLTKGWQTWQDAYLERQRHLRMLAGAAGRLMKPKLTAALVHWRVDWATERERELLKGQALLKRDQANAQARHAEELAKLKAEMEAAVAAKEEEMKRMGGDYLTKEQEHAKSLAEKMEAEGVQAAAALRPERRWWPWRRPRLRHQPRRPAHRGRRR